jgi:UDP-N-acetylmuramate--alanine ligase
MSQDDDPHATAGDPDAVVDLSSPRRIHVVGVGGAAMNGIATVLATMGHAVSGSDLAESPVLDRLRGQGIAVSVGHDADHVPPGVELVAVSTAIPPTNPELLEARRRGVTVSSRAGVLGAIAAQRRSVAVAGTHGKTTTSSLLAAILERGGVRPSFIIGGEVLDFDGGARWDDGELFVTEADESDGTFLELPRRAAIVTSIEPDHLDHYGGDFERLLAAFKTFLADTSGPTVVCADDVYAAELGRAVGSIGYGEATDADYRIEVHEGPGLGIDFSVHHDGSRVATVHLPLSGGYNARNACGALAMATELGVPVDVSVAALEAFRGVARRFERRGEVGGVTFIDDYAHIPTEVAGAVRAAVDGGWRRVVAAFQPHRYSRTEALWPSFADAFEGADLLAITDVYPAGEPPRPGVSGKLVVDAVLERHPWKRVAYLPTLDDLVGFLARELRPGDLCLTLGAGDLTTVPDAVQARLRSA